MALNSCGFFNTNQSFYTITNEFNSSEDRIIEFINKVNEGDKSYVLNSFSPYMKESCPSYEDKTDELMEFLDGGFVRFSDVPGNGASVGKHVERSPRYKERVRYYAHYTFETDSGTIYRMRMHWSRRDDFRADGTGTDYIFVEHYKGDGTYTPWSGEEYGIEIGE